MIQHYRLASAKYEWIDLEAPTPEDIKLIGAEYDINPIYLQDVLQPEHLPKWEYNEQQELYFLIARYADTSVKRADNLQQFTRKLAIFADKDRILTLHRAPIGFMSDLRERAEAPDSRFTLPFHVLCKLLKEVFQSYEPGVLATSDELEFYEGKIFQNKSLPPFIKGLFQLRKHVSVLRKVVVLSRTLLDAIRDQDEDAPQVQDAVDAFIRLESLVDDLHERTNNLISVHLALSDQRSNEVMRVLTVFSAFFLPVTFIAGVYGMNFEYMPELTQKYGYFISLGGMGAVSLSIFIWFKRKGWI
jgi:magnesium transporter